MKCVCGILALALLAAVGASAETLTDFEGDALLGYKVMFNQPSFSGTSVGLDRSTSPPLPPNVTAVSNYAAASGSQSLKVSWQFVDTNPLDWLRLTTYRGSGLTLGNPTVPFDKIISFKLLYEAGPDLGICIGLRETYSTAGIGQDGGSLGAIEYVGATGPKASFPNPDRVLSAAPGWQTFQFDLLRDRIQADSGDPLPDKPSSNGLLDSTTGKGVFEQIAFRSTGASNSAGPYTVYMDDVQVTSAVVPEPMSMLLAAPAIMGVLPIMQRRRRC